MNERGRIVSTFVMGLGTAIAVATIETLAGERNRVGYGSWLVRGGSAGRGWSCSSGAIAHRYVASERLVGF